MARGRGHFAMTHQALMMIYTGTGFEQIGGKRMAQVVNAAGLGDLISRKSDQSALPAKR